MNLAEIYRKMDKNKTNTRRDHIHAYSILIPLIEKKDGIHVLFEVRSLKLRRQPGEICFPGGKIEPRDPDPRACAIRETSEELAIAPSLIHNVEPLTAIKQPLSQRKIYPFIGTIPSDVEFKPNPLEVAEIFTVPLHFFLDHEPECYQVRFRVEPEPDFPYHLIPGGKNYPWRTRSIEECFYIYGNYTIWGLTARILRQFLQLIR